MKRIVVSAALLGLSILPSNAVAQTLVPTPLFEAATTISAKNGTVQPVHANIQSWRISGEKEIPLRGFYVAHLLSGTISTTVAGQTTIQPPGAYWSVKENATMQVKVLGELAVLETIVITKQ
jgi:hypothetical protein